MSENTGGAKKTFREAKKAYRDSKSDEGQENQNNEQVDNEEDDATSVQNTAKNSGKGKDGAKKAKNAAKSGKKFFNELKNIKSLAPLVSALSTIGIALLIIFLIIGFIGFFTTLPGLAMEKFLEACKNFWGWLTGAEKIEIKDDDLIELGEYIESIGYDLVGNGFVPESRLERNPESNEITGMDTRKWNLPGETPNYLYAYIIQNERTYTLRGVEKTGGNKILAYVPIIGNITGAIEDSFRDIMYVSNKSSYGMLHFDDLNKDSWNNVDDFTPIIDRDNNRLTIKTGFWNVSQMNWNLDGWTGRYGKPIELSLALHLSTMAPDFVYDFCMDDDLQTDVLLNSKEMNYKIEYVYIPNEKTDKDLTKEVIEHEFEEYIKDNQVYGYYKDLFESSDKLETYRDDDRIDLPMEILYNTSVIEIDGMLYKALDEDGKPIIVYDKDNKTAKKYKIEKKGDKVTFKESDDGVNLIERESYEKYQSDENNELDEIGDTIKMHTSIEDMIYILIFGTDVEKQEIIIQLYNDAIDGTRMEYMFNDFDECMRYIDDNLENINWRNPDKDYEEKWDDGIRSTIEDYDDSFSVTNGADLSENEWSEIYTKMCEFLRSISSSAKLDAGIIKDNMESVLLKNINVREDLGIDNEIFTTLYKVMHSLSTEVHTFKPYINKVTHHWYKDIYFIPDDKDKIPENWEKAYDFSRELEDVTDEFNPEGLANTEDIQTLKENGTIMYTLSSDDTDVKQINQPYTVGNEPWHNKVKNWLTSGYFFIYDGTIETANEIEEARKVLSGEYDPCNPLLIDNYANNELLVDSEGNVQPEVEEIDKKAKNLNDILASTEYKDGKKYKVRLQKINFAKKSSLTAFSILEGVHTRDGERVYHDLKEFMIELGYFTEADFETIESGVLDWIIPEYVPNEWPDKKYGRKNDEYGTFIRFKESVKDSKEEDKKDNIKDGFEAGLEVITPGQAEVIKVETDSITLKFTAENKVKDMTMKIKGISVNPDIAEGDQLESKQPIGTTTEEDIKLLMRDKKKAIINNIEDYMKAPEKLKKGGQGTIPLYSTSLSRQEFINGANNYSRISGTEFEGKMGEFYDICTKNGINPVIAFTRAIWESGLVNSNHNFWGLDAPNGSTAPQLADTMLGTLQIYCDRLNSYADPTTDLYNKIMDRYNERKECTDNGGCNPSGYGTPDTIEGIMSIYSYLGKHETGGAGSGGYYYMDPDVAGVTDIYETHDEFISLCKNKHSEGTDTTIWEQAQYTAYQIRLMAETAEEIWGEKALE